MRTKVSKQIAACYFLILVLAGPATAAITTYTNRRLWQAAAGATTGENFNSYLVDTPFHTVPVDVGPFTISMTPGAISDSWNFIDVPPPALSDFNVDGTNIANIGVGDQDAAFFTFDSPITSFGRRLRSVERWRAAIKYDHRRRRHRAAHDPGEPVHT